jgi:hypothetical protein
VSPHCKANKTCTVGIHADALYLHEHIWMRPTSEPLLIALLDGSRSGGSRRPMDESSVSDLSCAFSTTEMARCGDSWKVVLFPPVKIFIELDMTVGTRPSTAAALFSSSLRHAEVASLFHVVASFTRLVVVRYTHFPVLSASRAWCGWSVEWLV